MSYTTHHSTDPSSSKRASRFAPHALETALIDSLRGTDFLDVEFLAPTSRRPSGLVCKRRSIPANSAILKASCSYFRCLLAGGFAESQTAPSWSIEQAIESPQSAVGVFDEGMDSDFENVDEDTADSGWPIYFSPPSPVRATRCYRRVVTLHDIAATTLEALILYLYTGNLYFKPIQSYRPQFEKDLASIYEYEELKGKPMTSPKSMYRAADKMDLEELKSRSENVYLSQITKHNIIEELFSEFVSNYQDLIDKLVVRLRTNFWGSTTQQRLQEKVEKIVCGEMPHAGAALQQLLCQVNAERPMRPPAASRKVLDPLPLNDIHDNPTVIRTLPRAFVDPSRRVSFARTAVSIQPEP